MNIKNETELDAFGERATEAMDALTTAVKMAIDEDTTPEQDLLLFLCGVTDGCELRGRGLELVRRHERFLVTGQPDVLLRYEEEGIDEFDVPGVGLVELDEANDEEKLSVEFNKELYSGTCHLPTWAQRAVFDAWVDRRDEAAAAEQALEHSAEEWSDAEPPQGGEA